MATAITAEMFVKALIKRGIKYRFYKDFADFKVHNRNAQQGWGPIYGFLNHNFASDISDASSARYLYNGDLARGLPGPLVQMMIEDDGTLVLIGWGAANHSGPGDDKFIALVKKNALPLDRDFKPSTSGTSSSSLTSPMNAHFVGQEMAYGAKGTSAQYKTMIAVNAVVMELCGGPDNGYSGGSVGAHREVTTNRSDPTGFPAYQIRNDVNALLKAWNSVVPPVIQIPPIGDAPVSTQPAPDIANPTVRQIWSWDGIPAVDANEPGQDNDFWSAKNTLVFMYRAIIDLRKKTVTLMTASEEQDKAIGEIRATQLEMLAILKPEQPASTVTQDNA